MAAVAAEAAPVLDPALPGLAAALSDHPPGAASGDDCRVRHVEWVPGRRCRVVQEVRVSGRPTWVTYEVTPSGTTVRGLADDHALPGLPVALSPHHVRDRLTGICGAPVRACRVTPVSHRPGSRAVVAYDVVAASGRSRLYAKLLAGGSDRYATAAAALASSAGPPDTPAPVPEVVAHWADLGAVVQRAAPGRVLSAVLGDESLPAPERLRYAEQFGRLLARVHATPLDAAPRWCAEDELVALEILLAPAWHADPAVGRSLAALVDRLADAVPTDADPVLCHGAFRTGQVMAEGGALSLLDLDTTSRCDAARDAGNALAYLSWAGVRGALHPGLVPPLQDAFLAGYADARTSVGGQELAWWSAAAMAKIAGRRFRALATAEWRHVPELLARAATQVAPAAARGRPGPPAAPGATRPVDPLDSDRMTQVLREQFSVRAGDHIRVVAARTLAQAAGRRRVVRYEVEGLGADAAVPLIGKVYADRHRSSIAHANLRVLGDAVFAATPRLAVPAPVRHVPALRMVLYGQVNGAALDRLPAEAAEAAAGLAAGWLATLHASEAVLARRLDLAHEIGNVEAWAARVADRAPDARAAAYALADRLTTAAAALPGAPEVPIHKDFHAGHVIAVGSGAPGGVPAGVVVIDLDEARMGDPVLDVAHFATYLDVSPRARAGSVRAAFLAGYGPLPGPSPEARWAFFAAHTCLKIAKQLVTGRGPVLPPPGRERTAALRTVLRRGSACLAG